MTLGSPALAAYSLVLTSLNAKSAYHRVKASNSRHKKSVKEALISIQQASLELTKDDHLLEFIQSDHQWRKEIGERLSRRGTWSLATKASVAWVVIAFLLTLVDSFVSLDRSADNTADGHAVGTVWLWLLCLVVGWTWVPIFDSGEIMTALNYANQQAASNATKKLEQARKVAIIFLNRARGRLANRPAQGVGNRGNTGDGGPEPNQNDNLSVEPNGGEGADRADPATVEPPVKVDFKVDELLKLKNLGLLNRDERRLPATFNYSRTMRYLILVDDVLSALDTEKIAQEYEVGLSTQMPDWSCLADSQQKKSSAGNTVAPPVEEEVVFPRGALISMFKAAIMALILQCGTAAAAAIIIIFIPPLGLECRSLGYILYGGVSIVIMFLSIISTIFARISETRKERSTTVKDFTESIAIAFCRISYSLALINGVGLILLSCFQFARFLDNCYCNASVIGRGADSYIVVFYNGSEITMRNSRLAATLLSAVVMFIYMVILWRMTLLPDDLLDDSDDNDHAGDPS